MTELVIKPKNSPASPRGRVHTIHYELSYIHKGTIDPAAPVVVLLHGFPGDATVWQPVMDAITKYPVVAFDMLGFGESDKPWPADTSVWGHADALNLAIRDMGLQQVILVGYDLGGGVAQVLATRLLSEQVRGLVLIDSYAFQNSYNPTWPLADMEKGMDPELPFHTTPEELVAQLRQSFPQATANPDKLTGAALDRYLQPYSNEIGKEMFYQQVRKLTPYYLNAVAANLAAIAAPTLVIWGEKDAIFPPKWGERLRRTIPSSRLQIVPGAGHLILNDAPDRVASLVANFIAEV